MICDNVCYTSSMTSLTECSIEGCHAPRRSGKAEWCNTHYFRWYRNGSPVRLKNEEKAQSTCREQGCDSSPRLGGWGWCRLHYLRWQRHGDPQALYPDRKPRKLKTRGLFPQSVRSSDGTGRFEEFPGTISYRGLHARLVRARGAASAHQCACGKRAGQWAYDHTDPDQLHSPGGSPYSLDIRRYRPMCRSCHMTMDHAVRAR